MELPGFRISRYPITNTQYRAFIEDGGYQVAAYWQAAADEGYWKDGKVEDVYGEEWRDAPADFGVPFNLDNHPVVGVCWYEAVAFVQWLTDRLYRIEAIGREEVITLPTERQWEKAARGPDGFIYPWGKAADPDLANYDDTGIGATSAVGCFPRGASPLPCGAQEMAGNVWEWCLTKFQEDYNNYRDDNDLGGDARRVLRGGSFNFSAKHSRCAARYWDFPLVRYNFIGFRVVLLRSPSSL
jgi:formylglycine-generating enzyme required for sulfatase activity